MSDDNPPPPSPQQEPEPPPFPHGTPLDYRRPGDEPKYQPRTPFSAQMVAGFVAWVIGVIAVIVAATNTQGKFAKLAGNSGNATMCVLGGMLICLGGVAVWLRLRFRWRGFLPGLLIGFGLTCLVPVGIVAVICGMHK